MMTVTRLMSSWAVREHCTCLFGAVQPELLFRQLRIELVHVVDVCTSKQFSLNCSLQE